METRRLYYMPFCPLSRKIAFGLKEKGLDFKEIIEKTWKPSKDLFALNPTGELPVLVDDNIICSNDYVACEYLEEVYTHPGLMGDQPEHRAETRRLVSWFDRVFFQDVYLSIFYERALKQHMKGDGPNTSILKTGRSLLREHMVFINKLADSHTYLNGRSFSWADIAAAAHISCIDYLGDIMWNDFLAAKEWYMKIKSRPTFRNLLSKTFPGMMPAKHYINLDF